MCFLYSQSEVGTAVVVVVVVVVHVVVTGSVLVCLDDAKEWSRNRNAGEIEEGAREVKTAWGGRSVDCFKMLGFFYFPAASRLRNL